MVKYQRPFNVGDEALIKACRDHADWCSKEEVISHDSPVTGEMNKRIIQAVPGA